MLSDKTKHGLLLTAMTASTLFWCGCRSVPGLNRFARSSEPSADVLAGTGPSTTYPAPPSASATPQAIASVAGGTKVPGSQSLASGPATSPATAQVAGFDVSPGYATPATNYAAANANGVYGKPTSSPAGQTVGSAKPSPYTFGSKTFTPKSAPETSPTLPVTNYSSTGNSPYAKSSFGLPATTAPPSTTATAATNYTVPPTASMASQPVSASISSGSGSQSGFTLPTGVPSTATASITAPTNTASASAPSFGLPSTDSPAAASAPAYSTAGLSGSATTESTTSGYMPGSTGKASSYPASGQNTPATSGSYYR